MNHALLEVLIRNNSELIKANQQLAIGQQRTAKLAESGWKKREQLVEVCLQIFEQLVQQQNLKSHEKIWLKALKKAFNNDVENPNNFKEDS